MSVVQARTWGDTVHPECEAVIYTAGGDTLDVSGHIIRMQWSKALAGPSGMWQLQLRYSSDEFDDDWIPVQDDDWITIHAADRFGDRRHPLCLGVIDSVNVDSATDQFTGAPDIIVDISGRDFGKAFEVTDVFYNTWLRPAFDVPGLVTLGELRALSTQRFSGITQTPFQSIWRLLSIMLRSKRWWRMPGALGSSSLGQGIGYDCDVFDGEIWRSDSYAPFQAVKFDQYIRGIVGSPFVEWFYDLRAPSQYAEVSDQVVGDGATTITPPGNTSLPAQAYPKASGDFALALDGHTAGNAYRPMVVFRNAPFTKARWDRLQRYEVPDNLIGAANLVRSGMERYTAFAASSPFYTFAGEGAFWGYSGGELPILDIGQDGDAGFPYGLERHGLRFLHLRESLAIRGTAGEPAADALRRRTAELWEMFGDLPQLRSGTIPLRSWLPVVRVGTRVLAGGWDFYVNSTDVEFVQHPNGSVSTSMTLGVTRGRRDGDWPDRKIYRWDRPLPQASGGNG
jgi:hypothetical protein